ncbi:MAG TPA: IS1595 family transposase [Terriglobales bacterium]|nr:IS1595 family transposase [Terriglobales bacterium]
MKAPETLAQAIVYFSDPDRAFEYAKQLRWPDGKITCPHCESDRHSFIKTRRLWFCYGCQKQFTLKVGTIFEDSAIGLDKWMTAVWMLVNCRNGISSYELARDLGITQKSAWFMLQRIRLALQEKSFVKLGGPEGGHVEVDETFIGGKARNMHKSRRQKMMAIGRYAAKTAVMGMLERGGRVRAHVIGQRDKKQMHDLIREAVVPGTWVMTDEFPAYDGLSRDYTHLVANHLERYVHGNVHTQGIENFWSLLKRGLGGTYVAVEPFHLFRYVDEQAFRFNTRKDDEGRKISDPVRFAEAMSRVAGHRLTYAHLTGKDQSPRHEAAGSGPDQVPF